MWQGLLYQFQPGDADPNPEPLAWCKWVSFPEWVRTMRQGQERLPGRAQGGHEESGGMWLEQWIPSAILPLLGALGTPTVSITPFAPRSSLRPPPKFLPLP